MTGTTPSSMTESDLFNTFALPEVMVPLVALMNRHLHFKNKPSVKIDEMGPFVRSIFGCCHYSCTLMDVASHPKSYPLVSNAV